MSEGWIKSFKVHLLTEQETVKETYTEDELKRLLVKPNKRTATFSTYRNWAIINTLIGTGIRRSTLVNLKVSDIDFTKGLMVLGHTKNKKAKIVPLSSSLLSVLKEYVLLVKLQSDSYLFPDAYGQPMKPDRLSHIIASYNKKHGVNNTSVHAYRHTYAKMMVLAGVDVFHLQKLLGHSDLTMTRKYVELYGTELKEGYDAINPLERLNATRQKICI